MNTPNPHIDYDRYISFIRHSDESIEELLSGGADIDDLIVAGIIDDGDELSEEPEPALPLNPDLFDPENSEEF
jgi:hypothetical protein